MYSEYLRLSIFKKAKDNVSGSNSFTFMLAKIIIPSKRINYFYCWYAYFRWVDNIADSNNIPLSERLLFINHQIDLIENIYIKNISIDLLEEEEKFLFFLISFDNENGKIIKEFIIQMLECIEFDIKRVGIYSEAKQLEYFFNLEVLSYLNTFQFFCSSKNKFSKIIKSNEGNAGKWVHVIRDFIKDINESIFNLPKEDIQKYELNPYNNTDFFKTIGFKKWVVDRLQIAKENFKCGKKEVKNHPSLKYKILVIILCAKYELYLNAIVNNNYSLLPNYEIKKSSMIKILPSVIFKIISISILQIGYNRKN